MPDDMERSEFYYKLDRNIMVVCPAQRAILVYIYIALNQFVKSLLLMLVCLPFSWDPENRKQFHRIPAVTPRKLECAIDVARWTLRMTLIWMEKPLCLPTCNLIWIADVIRFFFSLLRNSLKLYSVAFQWLTMTWLPLAPLASMANCVQFDLFFDRKRNE